MLVLLELQLFHVYVLLLLLLLLLSIYLLLHLVVNFRVKSLFRMSTTLKPTSLSTNIRGITLLPTPTERILLMVLARIDLHTMLHLGSHEGAGKGRLPLLASSLDGA